jgi:hypothetical protein
VSHGTGLRSTVGLRAALRAGRRPDLRVTVAACLVSVLVLLGLAGTAMGAVPASASASAALGEGARTAATRVAIPALGIDLPVVSEYVTLDGNEPDYPLCDVAQYMAGYLDPGHPGTTYIYAHARPGMFLPLLEASLVEEGRSLIGLDALVYTSDARQYTYRVFLVKRHATDFSIANELVAGEQRLVLQTSEGPRGTVAVLQVAARLVSSAVANPDDANPPAHPTVCQDPAPPLISRRVLTVAGIALLALLVVAWWLRKKSRLLRPPPATMS